MDIHIIGIEKLINKLNRLANPNANGIVVEAMRKGVELTVQGIEDDAKRLAPVDTGRLRQSIVHETTVANDGVVGIVGTNVHYAIDQEFGTYRHKGTPFLRPAFATHAQNTTKNIHYYLIQEMSKL